MRPVRLHGLWRWVAATLGLGLLAVLLAHPPAGAASDVWGNVGPASPLGSSGLFGRYPPSHYMLDQHFDAVSASLTGGVDVSGVPPMIAYFLASVLWALTSFLANALISLFAFAFSLDLVNGSQATGGAGALAPVSQAIHAIYSDVFGAPWLVLAVAVVGIWAMWKALVQRRYAETAGALGLSLIYVVLALFFVAQPGKTIGAASQWTNQMSQAFLAVSGHGSATGGAGARDSDAQQLFDLLVFKPWTVLEFGGLEHCALAGSGSGETDPESVAVRPLSSSPDRNAVLARRLAAGAEVAADGKTCANNANKYASHFLRFGLGTDERNAEYDALDHGDSSRLPEADPERRGYRLGVTDKPATDAMEAGGQYQRLLIAIVVFGGELGAFCLLGALSVGVILAQVLLLLLLAFAPVALVAAAIPGRGHDFFKGWLEKLVGYLVRKAAYSLVLAVLLAVNGALAAATDSLGWLMSFGLQALFFWAVFLQRKALLEGLIGIAAGPGAPGREGTERVLALYAGARMTGRAGRSIGRGARSATRAPGRLFGGVLGSRGADKPSSPTASSASRFGASYGAPVGGQAPGLDARGSAERGRPADTAGDPGKGGRSRSTLAASGPVAAGVASAKSADRRSSRSQQEADRRAKAKGDGEKPSAESSGERRQRQAPPSSAELLGKKAARDSAASLGEEPRAEPERVRKAPSKSPEAQPPARRKSAPPPRRTPRKGGGR